MANASVVAVFDDADSANKAEQDLLNNGFNRSEVQVVANDASSMRTASATAGAGAYETGTGQTAVHEGGISGFFHRLFGSDKDDAEHGHYAEAVRRGSTVVTVTADEARIDRASEILNRYNPEDIDSKTNYFRDRGYTGYDAAAAPYNPEQIATERADYRNANTSQAIPVVEETMQVGKRTVRRGGVRVYSQLVETPVNEQVTLREERATVERRAVDRPATEADFRTGGGIVEVVETAEEAVIGKRARVVEEVVVGKQSSERTQTVSDTVRRTDIRVEKISPDTEADFERDYNTRYGSTAGATYANYQPAYDYGYHMAEDPLYKGKNWNEVEADLRRDYDRDVPDLPWDKSKDAVRYGWDRVPANTR